MFDSLLSFVMKKMGILSTSAQILRNQTVCSRAHY